MLCTCITTSYPSKKSLPSRQHSLSVSRYSPAGGQGRGAGWLAGWLASGSAPPLAAPSCIPPPCQACPCVWGWWARTPAACVQIHATTSLKVAAKHMHPQQQCSTLSPHLPSASGCSSAARRTAGRGPGRCGRPAGDWQWRVMGDRGGIRSTVQAAPTEAAHSRVASRREGCDPHHRSARTASVGTGRNCHSACRRPTHLQKSGVHLAYEAQRCLPVPKLVPPPGALAVVHLAGLDVGPLPARDPAGQRGGGGGGSVLG